MRGWWYALGAAVCIVVLGLSLASAQTTTSYTYDALGRLTGVTTPLGTTNYSYDQAGNRTSTISTVAARTATLVANPTSVAPGGSSTLTWTTTGGISASIDNGVGSVTPVSGGSVTVNPTATTTYTLTLTGVGGATATSPATVTVFPPTGTFAANPPAIVQGSSSLLSWTSSYASSASINNGVGTVAVPSGSATVTPSATTTYTLSLTGAGGTTTYPVTVSVNAAPTATLVASPSSIVQGSSSTLSWTSANVSSASINNGIGSVTVPSGSLPVSPSTTTTYTLTANGALGSTAVSSAVVAVGPGPTGTFTASPASILAGDSSTLSWTSANATGASIDNGIGTVAVPNGSVSVSPGGTTNYTLTLTGFAGSTANLPASVSVSPRPTGSLSANPTSILAGNSSTLSWTSANASSASIDNGVGNVAVPSGSAAVSPNTTTTYTLTANGALGSTATSPATVTVYARPTGSLSASPSSIFVGDSSTLSWTSANASSASINNGVGNVAVPSGSTSVSPNSTTTYTLTANGALGSTATSPTTVTVYSRPSASLSVSPTSILAGDSSTLSWTSANASSTSIDNGVGNVTPVPGGSVTVNPSATTTYTLTANGALGSTATSPATVTVYPRPSASLTLSPSAILLGNSTTLYWSTGNASSASITDGVQWGTQATPVSGGSVSVTPTGTLGTRTYTLTANGALGSTATSQASVTIYQPPVAILSVYPSGITAGQSTTLTWETAYASGASIDHGVGNVSPVSGGTITVSPTTTTTYTLTSTGALGSTATSQATVTVTAVNHPPVANADEIDVYADFKSQFSQCIDPRSNDTDPDGDTLAVSSITQPSPSYATASYGSSYVCVSGQANANRTTHMTYTVTDGRGGYSTATITINIWLNQ